MAEEMRTTTNSIKPMPPIAPAICIDADSGLKPLPKISVVSTNIFLGILFFQHNLRIFLKNHFLIHYLPELSETVSTSELGIGR